MLFKRDAKDRMRQWAFRTEGEYLIQESGLVGGKLITNRTKCHGKNLGKANATTAEEQAVLEGQSKYKKKMDQGYVESIEEAKTQKLIKPMLAQPYEKAEKHLDYQSSYGVWVEPKYDGMRLLAVVDDGKCTLYSRGGKLIDTLPHINYSMSNLPDDIYDGEAYADGEDFQDIMSWVKKHQEDSIKVKFHLYDIVSDRSYMSRRQMIQDLPIVDHVVKSDSSLVLSFDGVKEMHKDFVSQGYEGTIIRHGYWGYEMGKRSKQLIKYKDFLDEMFELIDIEEEDKREGFGKPVMHTKEGYEFKGSFKLSNQQKKHMLENRDEYIGKMVECRFFEYTTSDKPVPRFPVVLLRLDK